MKKISIPSIFLSSSAIALLITALFAIRFIDCLPFSGSTRAFNYETIATLSSYFIYAAEPLNFPLGSIKGLAFPFYDANVGNVGAIPLFAVFFKLLGQAFPYFLTFDYFILIEILSCFFTAYFSQRTLFALGVKDVRLSALGALLTGTSFLLMTRSGWLQPFCVASFPLLSAWIYAMLLSMRETGVSYRRDIAVVLLFPIAALVDNYSLFAILLGTFALLVREGYEAFFGCMPTSWRRVRRLLAFCVGGPLLALLALYIIGMFPLPPVPKSFSSYDFGLGGRYHVADLFAPWIPVANKVFAFAEPSLPGRLGFPITTDHLGEGQYEGVGYLGMPVILLWLAAAMLSLYSRFFGVRSPNVPGHGRLFLYTPWKKIGVAACVVFIFSLGYELRVLGHAFPEFSGMPAAWVADRIPSLYNIRATGRLAALLSLFLILEGVRLLNGWCEDRIEEGRLPSLSRKRTKKWSVWLFGALASLHFLEISPFMRPVASVSLNPRGGMFSSAEIDMLRQIGSRHDRVLIAPSVRAVDVRWTTDAFSAGYYLGLRSNLYYLARTLHEHDVRIARDLDWIQRGVWDPLFAEYGEQTLIVLPLKLAGPMRARMADTYTETVVGSLSLWSKRKADTSPER